MAMNLDDVRNNLKKFFRGEETDEGRRLIDRWYHYFDDKANELTGYSDEEKEELRHELWSDIEAATGPSKKQRRLPVQDYSPNRISRPAKIAAGFIITLLALLPVLYYQGILITEKRHTQAIEYRTASNPAGQTSQITLADGSTVWLSAASTLRYPERFEEGQREVTLEGEAFFDVVRNPEKPFIVSSEQLKTRVLGTSFNIRVFDGEEDIQVTVATGRVSVEQTTASIDSLKDDSVDPIAVLNPEQQLIFNKKTETGITQAVNSTLYTSWKDGRLIFDNHSFEEIAQRLERWYGVEIQFTDVVLKQVRFKVTFENNSLEHALRILQTIEDFEFEMKDEQVWIKPSA